LTDGLIYKDITKILLF